MTYFHQQSHKLDKVNSQAGSGVTWFLAILFLAWMCHAMDAGTDESITKPVKLWRSNVTDTQAKGIIDVFGQ